MGNMFKDLLDKLYPWTFHALGALIVIAFGLFLWFSIIGVKKFTEGMNTILKHNEKVQDLWNKNEELRINNEKNEMIANFVSSAIFNLKPYMDTLNEIRADSNATERKHNSHSLIQRLLDALSSDIKHKSGEHHRCCVWISDDQVLFPAVYSAGFPGNYHEMRRLDRDRSIAGRAFRTKLTQNIKDVTVDTEWVANPQSRSQYKSLICVPLREFGVLTIDGIEPMGPECEYICELYSSVIIGALNEYHISLQQENLLEEDPDDTEEYDDIEKKGEVS